ncbi:MAG TPA: bifunctional YncE family protein/alkaline phosphatase family protein [Candidatus Saccharimonadales bacterium]|nr:bifunctional YncE family protein/alkaline phosphatase family protein [Candidatus Saccharimonadales bacterium]
MLVALALAVVMPVAAQKKPATKGELLPTGMEITPTAARGSVFQPLNPGLPEMPGLTVDHPIATAISPDGGTLLVLTSGFNRVLDAKGHGVPVLASEYVFVFDISKPDISKPDITKPQPVQKQALKIPNTHSGLAWAPDGLRFYVSGGSDDNIWIFEQAGGKWAKSGEAIALGHKAGLGRPANMDGVVLPIRPMTAELAVAPSGKRLLVVNYQNDSVSLIDTTARKVISELDLRPGLNDPAKKGVPGGEYPFGVAFLGEDRAYVSSLRDREIVALDLKSTPKITGRIKTAGQPGRLLLNRAGTLLFAAADNNDTVVVVDTSKDRVLAEIKTTAPAAVWPNRAGFKGSNPNSLALSPDEKTLYVTNGGSNSVAVIRLDHDPDDSQVIGLIPTAWYPTSVSVSKDGKRLYVANGKSNAGPNPRGCRNTFSIAADDSPCSAAQQYILQLEKGGLTVVPRPSPAELHALTLQVARNDHFNVPARAADAEVFKFLRSKIHHVIYVVKENRSYDQVLGDLKKGNGDPALTLFPEAMSPNHHDLARRFVTLDNLFASGEVSGDGWNWSTAARATDVVERSIPMSYARRGMNYDVEGMNRGINPAAESAYDRRTEGLVHAEDQLPGNADLAAPDSADGEAGAGYLWDAVLRSRLSLRNYGFFLDLGRYAPGANSKPDVPLLHDPAATKTQVAFATRKSLTAVTDPYFRGFDMYLADFWRYREWEREFDQYVRDRNLPAMELVRLPHDHFGGFKDAIDKVNTVETQMADNDYALGLLVEKIAHSPFAADTLIFVIEDDAQNGPDHVDAHRTISYVIGPYVKKGAVVSKRFSTLSMLRTIEEVLGIQPLGMNDALQPPMTEVFSKSEAAWSYTAKVPAVLRSTELPLPPAAANPGEAAAAIPPAHNAGYWTEQTAGFDFSSEDRLDSERFNQVLWKGLKGEEEPYPTERSGEDMSKGRGRFLRGR